MRAVGVVAHDDEALARSKEATVATNPPQDFRDDIASAIIAALFELEPEPEISLRATTSDSPIVRLKLVDGQAFHITITRARS
jgi:hypothetical protein